MFDPLPRAQPPPVRTLRGWRWRASPLRRPSDVFQAWLGLGLALAVLVSAPLAAWAAGARVHHKLTTTADEQTRTGRHTTAELLHDAPRHPEPGSAEAQETRYPAQVRYRAPDGTTRTATAEVEPGLTAGSRVRLWTDVSGAPADPPLTADGIRNRVLASGAVTAVMVPASGLAVHRLTTRFLDHRRLRAWEAEWRETAPRWTTSP